MVAKTPTAIPLPPVPTRPIDEADHDCGRQTNVNSSSGLDSAPPELLRNKFTDQKSFNAAVPEAVGGVAPAVTVTD